MNTNEKENTTDKGNQSDQQQKDKKFASNVQNDKAPKKEGIGSDFQSGDDNESPKDFMQKDKGNQNESKDQRV